ncbi:hypothetical protein ABZT34_11700 [Streptomyces sp. NPDC005329]|uniref:hypothetical protein n=1 Tax=Streptomyces sp. NPDC005329 TaxID=3157034 RepID=UPI0033A19EBC
MTRALVGVSLHFTGDSHRLPVRAGHASTLTTAAALLAPPVLMLALLALVLPVLLLALLALVLPVLLLALLALVLPVLLLALLALPALVLLPAPHPRPCSTPWTSSSADVGKTLRVNTH